MERRASSEVGHGGPEDKPQSTGRTAPASADGKCGNGYLLENSLTFRPGSREPGWAHPGPADSVPLDWTARFRPP
jgi:hypothetical protein